MNKKYILILIIIAYIFAYMTYSHQVALTIGDIANVINKFNIPKLLISSVGLAFNFFVIFIMVNLFWLFTSLGITFNKGENLKDYEVKKADYFIVFFGVYSLHFAILTLSSIFLGETISAEISGLLKYSNITVVFVTFIIVMWYQFKKNILTKISTISITTLTIINVAYTLITQ
ncbi:hypothetical protein BACPU_13880 [Bacillus pumilus]|nr:hypothetical protein BACPU_13880 [Bacillus pumilus]